MKNWSGRLGVAALFVLSAVAHACASWAVSNTPLGMAIFHGGAGLIDFMALVAMPCFIPGRLCRDTQILLGCAILSNALGFGLYMAYASPVYYDSLMWSISLFQALRLWYVAESDDDYCSPYLKVA